MSVTLSTSDVERLARTVELLVSPLDHPTVDDWRSAVNRELADLVGADSAGFMLPVGDGPFIYSDEHDPAELARYPGFLPPPLPDGTPFWSSLLSIGTGSLADIYRGGAHIYSESAYYRDYAGANGAHDTIAFAVSLVDGSVDIRDSASMQLWHGSQRGRRFGERELALLRVLRPAFRAGVQTQRQFGGRHAHLIEMMDALNHAVRICDAQGRRLHRSRALSELLAADPDADAIVRALDEAVRAARLALAPGPSADDGCSEPRLTLEVRTPIARYGVVVTSCRGLAGAPGALLIAAVERLTPLPRSEDEIRREFGLTRAEARVATLLAQGLSNGDIADRLCISPHTCRRHTERVLLKVGVRSRAEVGPKILR